MRTGLDLNLCRLTDGTHVEMKNTKKSKTFMFGSQDQLTSFKLLYQRLHPRNRKQIIPLIRGCEKRFRLNENPKLWRERSCMDERMPSAQLNVLPDPSQLCCLQKSSSQSYTSSTPFQSKTPAQFHIQHPRFQRYMLWI